jgi:hypothetical protein
MSKILWVWIPLVAGSVAAADVKSDALALAKSEGGVRDVVRQCWESAPSERVKLMKMSVDYIGRLSLATGVAAVELNAALEAGAAAAVAKGKLSADQCKKARELMPKMLEERGKKVAGA